MVCSAVVLDMPQCAYMPKAKYYSIVGTSLLIHLPKITDKLQNSLPNISTYHL